jgi:hypothetical protein
MVMRIKKVSSETKSKHFFNHTKCHILYLDLVTRCRRLRDLGIIGKLQAMEKDSSRDVRDRANSALDQLREVLAESSST